MNLLHYSVIQSLEDVDPDEWNALGGIDNPFVSYEFLAALERHDCVGETFGWYPHFVVGHDEAGHLRAAMPMYAKNNSYGEFVFDWSWADAWERNGRPYYPKLVIASPYTPATGPRLLIHPGLDAEPVRRQMADLAIELANKQRHSGVHWLFTTEDETRSLRDQGMILRLGCQYHWTNHGYRDFDDFLDTCTSKRRKTMRRERRRVEEQHVEVRVLHGDEMNDADWQVFHRFYLSTFDRKWGVPTLSLGFFREIGRTMGHRVVVVLADYEGRPVAGALNFRGSDTLYGRYWGCDTDFHSLHFEACYYQGIDYAIAQGLKRFEPGAQGEHKIWRGFLPTPTWSAHWIRDPAFRPAITEFCRREQSLMQRECGELMQLSPFREGTPAGEYRPHPSLD